MGETLRNYKFAIELVISSFEGIEYRILNILNLCEEKHGSLIFELQDIEATGLIGSQLTEEFEKKNEYKNLSDDLIEILKENGQIIELDLLVYRNSFSAWIIVRRGKEVNFLSNDKSLLDNKKIGDYLVLDVSLFW